MSDRARLVDRFAPLVLLLALAAAWALPEQGWLTLAAPDPDARARVTTALDALPAESLVVFGFDPDLGTYAEIRPTVRALIDDLLARGARLAFVSLTPEGRALALAEMDRLARGDGGRVVDLGFVPGAEAALVMLARGDRDGILEDGLATADAAVVIGGNDLGPRTWVEQVAPRVEDLPLIAVAPTILLPQLQPYLATGQLQALLATPRDGAAYRDGLGRPAADHAGPMTLPILLGLLAALGVLGDGLAQRVMRGVQASRTRDAA